MSDWTVIDYTRYSDVPREFVVRHGEHAYYFESPFDEMLDDYTPFFYVYRIRASDVETPLTGWSEFRRTGARLPDIPVANLRFHAEPIPDHPTRRHLRFVHDSIFEILERKRSAA